MWASCLIFYLHKNKIQKIGIKKTHNKSNINLNKSTQKRTINGNGNECPKKGLIQSNYLFLHKKGVLLTNKNS